MRLVDPVEEFGGMQLTLFFVSPALAAVVFVLLPPGLFVLSPLAKLLTTAQSGPHQSEVNYPVCSTLLPLFRRACCRCTGSANLPESHEMRPRPMTLASQRVLMALGVAAMLTRPSSSSFSAGLAFRTRFALASATKSYSPAIASPISLPLLNRILRTQSSAIGLASAGLASLGCDPAPVC